jgi:hypothetical protein
LLRKKKEEDKLTKTEIVWKKEKIILLYNLKRKACFSDID